MARDPQQPRRHPLFFLRILLINRPTQLMLLGYNMISILVTALLFVALSLTLSQGESLSESYLLVLVLGFATFLMLFILGFWVSNKLVGPIYRMEKHMQAVIKGEASGELQFRKGDHFQHTAEIYNQLLKHFRQQGKGS